MKALRDSWLFLVLMLKRTCLREDPICKEKAVFYLRTDLAKLHLALEFARMQARCNGLPKETERDRLLKKARAGRPSLWRRFLLRAGDVLISSGLWLKSRCQPALAPSVLEASQQR